MCFFNTSLNTSFSVQHEVHNREALRTTYFDHVSIFTTTLSCAPPQHLAHDIPHNPHISPSDNHLTLPDLSLHQPPYLRTCTPFPLSIGPTHSSTSSSTHLPLFLAVHLPPNHLLLLVASSITPAATEPRVPHFLARTLPEPTTFFFPLPEN
ncbi:hypothetical protein PTI98_013636 [Pleurotus ostreatus]|nr:hypothetical protein PTI98_013636 [Pleurotus ostreatus]